MKTINIISINGIVFIIAMMIIAVFFNNSSESKLSDLRNELNKKDSLLLHKQESLNTAIEINFKMDSIIELNPKLKEFKQNDKELIKLNSELWNY